MNLNAFDKYSWNEILIWNLILHNNRLEKIWNLFEKTLRKRENEKIKNLNRIKGCKKYFRRKKKNNLRNQDNISYTSEERKIIEWYKEKETKDYPKFWSKKAKFIPSKESRDFLNEIRSKEFYYLKKIVEFMLKDLLDEYLKEIFPDLKVFMASDIDDVQSQVDVIVEVPLFNDKKYFWVDFCVSRNKRYILEKSKKKVTTPHGFHYYTWKWKNIDRMVKDFNPMAISYLLESYLNSIISWKKITNLKQKYDDIKSKLISRWVELTREITTIEDTVDIILEKCNNIN